MAESSLGAEDAQPGEAGERDDQRPGEAAGEAREGRLVAFLLQGGHQQPAASRPDPARTGAGSVRRNTGTYPPRGMSIRRWLARPSVR